MLIGLAVVCAALIAAPAAPAQPGTWTQADINAAITKALGYLDTQQNADGSWGTTYPGAETALALSAYGVEGYSNLSAAEQTRVQKGMTFLLGTQGSDGSFSHDGLRTYDTGTALLALSLLGDVPTTPAGAIPTAIANGRSYLIKNQEITANGTSPACTPGGTSAQGGNFCGGWDYNQALNDARSDESNTGFALTGLELTGGVPTSVAANNLGWQRNVQQLTTNPGGFPARNDGGGAYQPGINSGDFSSNANDNGSLTFGLGYDGVTASDPGVQAAIKIAQDTFDVYETAGSRADRVMVYHTGTNEDGSCDPKATGCDWSEGSGEGGYHYSIFALVKGLSQYVTPDLTDATNFYAKAVDLLLSQQSTDGSWPADLRDDASVIGATGFSVLALGRVGAPPDQPITASGASALSATVGQPVSGTVATFSDPDTAATASEYSATIDWGDGSTSTGTISGAGGSFTVSGSHTYTGAGTYSIQVTITDVDNTSNTATATTPATATAPTAPTAPAAVTGQPSVIPIPVGATQASTTAAFSGLVNPDGQSTTAYFEYGLDPAYTGGAPFAYTNQVAALPYPVGADFNFDPVSANATGLVPNALYHVRLVAVSASGTVYGPDFLFNTTKAALPGPPVLGQTVNAVPVAGRVYVKVPGAGSSRSTPKSGPGFVPLTMVRSLPVGTQFDTRTGAVKLITASATSKTLQSAVYGGAVFSFGQARSGKSRGLATANILEGAFPGAPSYASCTAKTARTGPRVAVAGPLAQVAVSSSVLSTLRVHSRGSYSSRGHYGSATARATAWTMSDRCDGTLVTVQKDVVFVRDFVRHKTITLRTGQHYLIKK